MTGTAEWWSRVHRTVSGFCTETGMHGNYKEEINGKNGKHRCGHGASKGETTLFLPFFLP